jgi:glutaredoxin
MKPILMFYLDDCGYCHKAHRAMDELFEENPAYRALEITKVEESRQPELADRYDYYAVPTFYVAGEKLFEAHIGMSYEDIKAEVRRVLDAAQL